MPEGVVSAIFLSILGAGKERRVLTENAPGPLKKVVIHVGGISLILLGIVGLFLPILQGILLIVGGVGLLSIGNERVRKWIVALKRRYPRQALAFKKIKTKIVSQKKPSHDYVNGGLEQGADDHR